MEYASLDSNSVRVLHVFRREQFWTSTKMSAVFLQDKKDRRCHLLLKLRTSSIYCSGVAENRRSCSPEIAVMDATRETASTLRSKFD